MIHPLFPSFCFSGRRRHTRSTRDWSSDVCSSDLAVQIAKALGAEVTGVCSTRNVEQARSLGADHVIDYTGEDFTRTGQRFDLILDIAGSKSWSQCRRALNPNAILVIVGAKGSRLMGPLGHIAKVRLGALRGSQRAVFFVANFNGPDLAVLSEL